MNRIAYPPRQRASLRASSRRAETRSLSKVACNL
jgi:hypothetical protein